MPTVELAQGRIHYSDDGRGPTVVLVHGAFVSARLWRKVIPILSRTNRVIAPHLPLGAHPSRCAPRPTSRPSAWPACWPTCSSASTSTT
jgi:pimeloyl-ACP methyl ester carboxylesterase